MPHLVLVLCAFAIVTSCKAHADWPQWRGPHSNSVAPATSSPAPLDLDKHLAWKADLPGPGASTPIQAADSILVTCQIDDQDSLVAYDHSGNELWRRSFGPGREGKHRNATGANSSPVTDGQRVFAYYKSGLLIALTIGGEELWRLNLQEDFAPDTLWWDLGTSPILTPTGVVIAVIQAGESYLACFDVASGELIWKQTRNIDRPQESDQSYTTPTLTETEHGPTIVVWGADYVTGHNPSTGAELFRCGGFNPEDKPMWRSIASATISNGMVLVPFGRSEFIGAMQLGGEGDTTATHRQWTVSGVGCDVTCPVVQEGLAYILGDRGTITCLRIEDGEIVWQASLPRSKNKYFASPLLVDDTMYCIREDGVGYMLRIEDNGAEVVGECDFGETLVASPTPLGQDRLLVRSREALYCFAAEL